MAEITKIKLSGTPTGNLGVKLTTTSTSSAVTIHTSVSGTTDFDEVWLWAQNSDAGGIKLTLEVGGTTDPDNLIEVTIPGESGLVQVIPGIVFQNGATIKGFASSADKIMMYGYANRLNY
tara:strand:- start:121 stop:480 length:360 start_codon:yes stop_codon:yes gene_type:complete